MNDKCTSCFHKHMSKVYDPLRLNSPCYDCLYNSEMIKTNNYMETNVLSFPNQKTITSNDIE